MSSPLLHLPGAIEAEALGVAEHYGHPLAESRALEEGRAIVDLSHEGILKVTGADRLTWLHSMTSQRLDNLKPGESTETLVLNPQGRIEVSVGVVDDGEATWLLTSAAGVKGLQEFLLKMRFAMRVEVSDESETFAQVLTFSEDIAKKIAAAVTIAAQWIDPWAEVLPGGYQYAKGGSYLWTARRLLIARDQLSNLYKLVREGEFGVAGLSSLAALEVRAWRPTMADVDERTIPHELDWMRTAVHLNKGCYRGQETVAKVHNLGRPPRRLVMLHLDGADAEMPAPGALIYVEGDETKPVGRVTRAALHHDWGPIALGLLKRNTVADCRFSVALPSGAFCVAEQEVIVPPDAGASNVVPRIPRLK
ncbi:MAG TPA: folate-binding protein [Microbacteriaceae bacterium]|nr:folate-binding protein [Microbacteriaceae bacterium]